MLNEGGNMEGERAYIEFKRAAIELAAPVIMSYWSDLQASSPVGGNAGRERLILPLAAQAATGAFESLRPSPAEISGWQVEVDPLMADAGRADRLSTRQVVLGDLILTLLAVTVGRLDVNLAAIAVSDRLACLPTTDYAHRSRLVGAQIAHDQGPRWIG